MSGPDAQRVREQLARVEQLIAEIERSHDPAAREAARAVVAAVLDLHGAGIARMLELAGGTPERGEAGRAVVADFARDPLVASVLLLHGLHPDDLATRARRAVEAMRAELGARGAGVELAGVADGVIRVRLAPAGGDRGSLRVAVEQALAEAAPDAVAVEIEVEVAVAVETPGFVPLERLVAARRDREGAGKGEAR